MNNSTASGVFNEAKGKLKQAVGETFDDQSLANEGTADEVKGHAQQTWGSVKDTAHDVAKNTETPYDPANPSYSTDPVYRNEHKTGHDLRTGIANAAASVKESIQHGLDHIEHHAKH
jgi:uncharacterized protein YjbJ (UPF0337 family)